MRYSTIGNSKQSAAVLTATVLVTSVMIITSFQLPQAAAATNEDIADFNGDGFADLAIGAPSSDAESTVTIVYGSASGLSNLPGEVWNPISEYFGWSLTIADFNADGYSDLAVGAQEGQVFIRFGSSEGLSATEAGDGTGRAEQRFTTSDGVLFPLPSDSRGGQEPGKFGFSVASGDFNNDGYDDLAVGAPEYEIAFGVDPGAVYVIYGSSEGLSPDAIGPGNGKNYQRWTQNSGNVEGVAEHGDRFGSSLAVADFNSDHYEDLAIGVPSESIGTIGGAGVVNVIYGSSQGLKVSAAADGSGRNDQYWHQNNGPVGAAEISDFFGGALATGDFNLDGYYDLAVGVPHESIGGFERAGAVNVLYGSSMGLGVLAAPDGTGRSDQMWHQNAPMIDETSETPDIFGSSLTSGDFNGDGYDDLAIGAPWETIGLASRAGIVNVIYGSPSGLSATFVPDQLWHQNSANIENIAESNDQFGHSLASGDFNGDGYADLAVGVPTNSGDNAPYGGAVSVIYGSGSGLSATFVADQYIHDPTIFGEFGRSLASTSSQSAFNDCPC